VLLNTIPVRIINYDGLQIAIKRVRTSWCTTCLVEAEVFFETSRILWSIVTVSLSPTPLIETSPFSHIDDSWHRLREIWRHRDSRRRRCVQKYSELRTFWLTFHETRKSIGKVTPLAVRLTVYILTTQTNGSAQTCVNAKYQVPTTICRSWYYGGPVSVVSLPRTLMMASPARRRILRTLLQLCRLHGVKLEDDCGRCIAMHVVEKAVYDGVSKSFRTESKTIYTLTTINTGWEAI
jgi:hypothetical protein